MNDLPALLLVEDESLIRTAVAEALQEAGYRLLESGSGEDAISQLDGGASIAGIVTDIRLGAKLSGWDIARHARQLQPGIPVVYMSGDSAADWTVEGVPNSVMVQKPFATAQVVTAVSTLLNAAGPSSS